MGTKRFWHAATSLGLLLGMAACATESATDGDVGTAEGAETWNDANNPKNVDETFIHDVDALPVTGAAATPPISGDYWATYQDSLNQRWDGENSLSPSEKYAKAFNKPGLERVISEEYGIRGKTNRTECTKREDCNQKQAETCAIPRGETKGRCIPTWWGICHGWAPYAFSEPAAKNPVTKNGVTFYAGDLEGLMSLAYGEGLPTKFLSERCNKDLAGTGAGKVSVDRSGRVVDGECRDMNPGSFHVLATNMLGLRQQSFVYDRTIDSQVWNQPVRDYKITNQENGKLKEVSKEQATTLVGTAAQFDASAKRFFHVRMDFRYIGEPPTSSRTPINPDTQTYTDQLEYVLEVNQDGRIVGGEWVGESRTAHPDFAWWPTGKPTKTVARGMISYEEIKALNDEAAGIGKNGVQAAAGGPGSTQTIELAKEVTIEAGRLYRVKKAVGVPGGGKLVVTAKGTGDTNLWVVLGERSTNESSCKTDEPGTTNETCTIAAPERGGSYKVTLKATKTSTVTISATVTR